MEKFSFFNDINDDRVYYAEDFARHLKNTLQMVFSTMS